MRSWDDKDLRDAVASSHSLASASRKLGLNPAGHNFRTLKKYILRLSIDTSHFSRLVYSSRRLSFDEIFCVESHVMSSKLSRYLERENVLKYECKECGNTGSHNGRILKLQVDHENGVHNDNRLENLRWLCPNCHSQTPTFSRGNSQKILKTASLYSANKPAKTVNLTCSQCGNGFVRTEAKIRFSGGLKDKSYCSPICSSMSNAKCDHESVYKRYLSFQSYLGVAKEFGVSDNLVRRIVKKQAAIRDRIIG